MIYLFFKFSYICINILFFISYEIWLNGSNFGTSFLADKLTGNAVVGLFFVAIAHTLVVAVMISAGFRISGGHLNPAVTLGLCVGGHITVFRSILYWIDQCLASVAACALLKYLTGGLVSLIIALWGGIEPTIKVYWHMHYFKITT